MPDIARLKEEIAACQAELKKPALTIDGVLHEMGSFADIHTARSRVASNRKRRRSTKAWLADLKAELKAATNA